MKVTIEEHVTNEEAIIRCQSITKDIMEAVNILQHGHVQLMGRADEQIHHISIHDILYFEAVDNRVFFHTLSQSFETKLKLYELETQLLHLGMLRVSKAFILNLHKINHLSPAFNGRFEATLVNDEKVIISRQYVKKLKDVLQMQ